MDKPEIPTIGICPKKTIGDFWDKQPTGGILPNLLNWIDSPKIPWAGFAHKTRPEFSG